jgi:hypothetical protein
MLAALWGSRATDIFRKSELDLKPRASIEMTGRHRKLRGRRDQRVGSPDGSQRQGSHVSPPCGKRAEPSNFGRAELGCRPKVALRAINIPRGLNGTGLPGSRRTLAHGSLREGEASFMGSTIGRPTKATFHNYFSLQKLIRLSNSY